MNSFIKTFKSSVGFTLIELLVVIGILGVLAAALVATIDPFEQLKKATDANTKNTAVEFVNANIRYYTTHTMMPWAESANNATCLVDSETAVSLSNADSSLGCLQALIADGELKEGFTSIEGTLEKIFISGSANTVVSCFTPESKAEQNNVYTKYDVLGNVIEDGSCPTSGEGHTSCFWCAK